MVARYAERETSTEMGAFLVEAGLKLEAQNKWGETALFIIGKEDMFSPLFDYLKEKGAKVNAADANGNTILHHFIFQRLPPEPHIEKAVDSGISPYQKNRLGLSPLMLSKFKKYHFINRIEKMKRWHRRYIEENSDVPPEDNLHLAPVEGGREKMSIMSRCHNFVSTLLRRKRRIEGGGMI